MYVRPLHPEVIHFLSIHLHEQHQTTAESEKVSNRITEPAFHQSHPESGRRKHQRQQGKTTTSELVLPKD
jgi:hypothetical protein